MTRTKAWGVAGLCAALTALACGVGDGTDPGPLNAAEPGSEAPVVTPQPTKAGTIGNGTWLVGKTADIRAGTYRSIGAVDGSVVFCSWFITRGGETTDVGSSDKLSDPQLVKLKDGDQFETDGCAVWVKR